MRNLGTIIAIRQVDRTGRADDGREEEHRKVSVHRARDVDGLIYQGLRVRNYGYPRA